MRKLLLFLFLAVPVFAQNSRYDSVALGPRGPIPNASIAVCTQPANTTTTPCSPLANLCSSLTDATCTSPNPITADSLGNYHFYVKTSQAPVTVQLYGPQVAAPVVLPDQASGPSLGGNNAFTGNNTHSGTETFTGILRTGNTNNYCFLDGAVNATLAAALACAASNGTIEVSPSAGTVSVPSSTTIPSGVQLIVDKGAKLSIAAGQTLTINGTFQTGNYQAFVTQATGSPIAITAATESTSGSAIAITAASETGNIMTFSSTLNPGVGNTVIVTGVTPAGYNSGSNGGWTVLVSNGTTFTAFNQTTGLGAGTVFGTAQVATNTVTFTSTLNPAVGMPVTVAGVTPTAYNSTYLVLTTNASSFTVYHPVAGIVAGSVFGTATQGGAVAFGTPNDVYVRPEWFGAVADGTSPASCCTAITGTDDYPAFLSALASLPVFNFPLQGSYTLENGQLARTGKMLLSNGRYVTSSTLQWSPYVSYEAPSYQGTRIVLKDGVATTGPEVWTVNVMFITTGGGTGPNASYGAQFKNLMVDCQAGVEGINQGTNVTASGVRFNGAQGSGLGAIWIHNCGFRGLLLNALGGNGTGTNVGSDVEVLYVKVGPGVELDASTSTFSTLRAEHVNINGTYLDPDGDPNPAISYGSVSYNCNNVVVAEQTGEFDGLPMKIWNCQAVNIGNITTATISGGQSTLAIIRSGATGIVFGPMFTNASSPNLFANFVVDRSTTPTTNISGNFANFPVILGYSNAGTTPMNSMQFPLVSSVPSNLQKANFAGCYGDSTANTLKCSYNNGSFFNVPQVIGSGTATMTTAAITAGNCGTTVTVAATGVLTTDRITWSFNAAPAGSNAGLVAWPTANNVNFAYCPNSAETPAAATINWGITR